MSEFVPVAREDEVPIGEVKVVHAGDKSLALGLCNDGTWGAWEVSRETNSPVVSAEHPESILLTWRAPVSLRGLNALWAGFGAAEVRHVSPSFLPIWTRRKGGTGIFLDL